MFYELLEIINKGTKKANIYVYRDTNGVIYRFKSKQIKDNWVGNKFQGVTMDNVGRLVKATASAPDSNPRQVISAPVSINMRGYQVYTGGSLQTLVDRVVADKNKRYAVWQILATLSDYQAGKVCAVKGLRRTGKTTAIIQAIGELLARGVPADNIGYITVTEAADTIEVVKLLGENTWEYVFVDEVTHLSGILNWLKTVSDVISFEKKVVLTGTDSFVWPIAAMDVLYGRTAPIDLTYMSLKEYCEVFPGRVEGLSPNDIVSHFCMYGGVLSMSEYAGLGNAYVSLQTALAANIVNTIQRNKDHPTVKAHTGALYSASKEQITEAIICAIITACDTQNAEAFKTSGVKLPALASDVFALIDAERQLAIKASGINQKVLLSFLSALVQLNVLSRVQNFATKSAKVEPQGKTKLTCHFSSLYSTITGAISTKLGMSGAAYENLILSQCVQFCNALQQSYVVGGRIEGVEVGFCWYEIPAEAFDRETDRNPTPEADIVVRHRKSGEIEKQVFIEVKKGADRAGYAANMFVPTMAEALGKIDRFIVVYSGDSVKEREVEYVNAFDFLMDMGKYVL